MADEYYADVYLRGCGELTIQGTEVDDSDPEIVVLTVRAYKPGEPEEIPEPEPKRPAYAYPLDDPRHRCVQGLCDDHAGTP